MVLGGSYFPGEQLLVALLCALLAAWSLLLRPRAAVGAALPFLLIAVAQVIALLRAVDPGAQLENAVIWCALAWLMVEMSAWSIADLSATLRWTGMGVVAWAALSLLAGLGFRVGAWFGQGRLSGPFGYADTAGAVLGAFWLISSDWPEALTEAWAFSMRVVLFAALVLTLSRGAWLAVAAGVAVLLLLRGWRHCVAVLLPVAVWGMLAAVATHSFQLVGLVAVCALLWLLPSRWRTAWPSLVPAGAAAALGLGRWSLLLARVGGHGRAATAIERLEYWATALRMLGHFPLGAGAGAWAALYPTWQRAGFVSAQIHNGYLEMALEVGIPFACLAVALFAWNLGRSDLGQTVVGSLGGLSVLLAHAAVDLDWSFFSVWLLTAVLSAVVLRPRPLPGFACAQPRRSVLGRKMGVLLSALVAAAAAWLLVALAIGAVGARWQARGHAAWALDALGAAVRLDPWSVTARLELATAVAVALPSGDPALRSAGDRALQVAVRLEGRSASVLDAVAQDYLALGQPGRAWPEAARAVALAPYEASVYVSAGLLAQQLASAAVSSGRCQQAAGWDQQLQDLATRARTFKAAARGAAGSLTADQAVVARALKSCAAGPQRG